MGNKQANNNNGYESLGNAENLDPTSRMLVSRNKSQTSGDQNISFDSRRKINDGLSQDLQVGSVSITNSTIPYDDTDTSEIHENWSQYTKMLRNIGWKTIPNFIDVKNDKIYWNVILAIKKHTNNTPSKIENKSQFINMLENIPFETREIDEQHSVQNITFYDYNRQFIDDNLIDDDDNNNDDEYKGIDEYGSPSWMSNNDMRAYRPKTNKRANPKRERQLKQQKVWVIINSIFLLFVSGVSLPLLYSKQNILNNFYNDSGIECCYCLWIGEKVEHSYKIEWSPCVPNKKHPKADQDMNKICYINGTHYCNTTEQDSITEQNSLKWPSSNNLLDGGDFSKTSTFFFYTFHKNYPYYGYLNGSIAVIYIIYIIYNTFYYQILLSVQLFIGNMVLAADIFYTYIKLYQYSKHPYYDESCPTDWPPLDQQRVCYRNAIEDYMESILTLWVGFVMFCICYPFVLIVGCRFCNKINCCTATRNRFERWLRNLGVIGGFFFVFMGLYTLIRIIVERKTDFDIMGMKQTWIEKVFIIIVVIFVTIFAFDVFALAHCRDRAKLMYDNCIRKRNHQPYSAVMEDDTHS